jgi:radical SAM superfamily enzyme YgiQ (UPF0313 family)
MSIRQCVDVVLIDTGFDGIARFQLKERSQPHLGLAYIAAYLEQNSYTVKIIDRIVNPLSPEEVAEIVIDCNPKVVGITTSTIDRFLAIKILNEIKLLSSDILTVGGGPHFSSTAIDALEQINSLDVVCVGEGEYTLCEIVETYTNNKNKKDFSNIDGAVYSNSEDRIIKNKNRALIRDLDSLPFPAWHLFDIDKYIGSLATASKASLRAIGIGSSRGCPYSCAFCYNSLSKKVRNFSIPRFVDMIELLKIKYNFNAFNFVDDSFTCNVNRVIDICNEIIKRNLDIKWYCSLNVNQAAHNIKMLETMKKAGCIALGFGLEFPNDKVLKAIKKKSSTKLIKKAIVNVRKVDFPFVQIFLLQGLPEQNIFNTISANLRTIYYRAILRDKKIYFGGFVQIYPETNLELVSKAQGQIDKDFSWNSPYVSPVAKKYKKSPNQQNKLPTVPLFIPEKISMDHIIYINKIMIYLAKVSHLGQKLFEYFFKVTIKIV